MLITINAVVGFFLNGRVLPNNSIVLLSDIGEGSSGLFCLTDRTRCCSTAAGGEGHGSWGFPNGSEVMRSVSMREIHWNQSYSSVILNRRNKAMEPTGIYTCEIPYVRNITRTLYIGVYGSEFAGISRGSD